MKKIIAWLLVLALTAAISIGATLAYLTDTDEDVNVMTLGNVKIDQLEYERVNDETANEKAEVQEFHDNKPLYPAVTDKNFDYTPGDTYVDWDQIGKDGYESEIWNPEKINNELDKMVFVKNKGSYDAYVRTVFAFEAGKYTTLDEFKSMMHLNLNETDFTWEWIEDPVTIGESTYFVATATYNYVLEPGALTEISLSQIALDKTATNADVEAFGDTYQILVKSQGIQAAGFDTADFALNGGFGIVDAKNIPWNTDQPVQGTDLKNALHYLNGDGKTQITDKVISVTFGTNKDYAQIADNHTGTLVTAEQDVDVHCYYVPNDSNYDVYILSDSDINAPENCNGLFQKMSRLKSVNTQNLDTSRTNNMNYMFAYCPVLTELDLSHWDVSNVTSMVGTFGICDNLKTVDVTGWDTSKVTSLKTLFYNDYALEEIKGIEDWDTSSNTNMYYMFQKCYNLKTVDIGNWNVSNVTDMRGVFFTCTGLENLDLSGWRPVSVTNTHGMFAKCSALQSVNVTGWKLPSLNSAGSMFNGCTNLTDIIGSGTMYMPSVVDLSGMLQECDSLVYIDVTNWDLSSAENMYSMFFSCDNLVTIEGCENWDTGNVTSMKSMFETSHSLKDVDVSTWDTSSVTDMSHMFRAHGLEELDVSNWDVSNVTAFNSMFSSAKSNTGDMSLKALDLSQWNPKSAVAMDHMFQGCSQITALDLSGWNMPNLTTTSHMFSDCFDLQSIDFTGWNTPALTSMDGMFNDCRTIKEIDVSHFDTENCLEFSQMFEACYALEKIIGMDQWDTSSAYVFDEMFHLASKLKEVDFSSFDTSAVTYGYTLQNGETGYHGYGSMFNGTTGLQKLIMSDKFVFAGDGTLQPGNYPKFPNPAPKEGYTAMWRNVETGELYLGKDIPEKVAATYEAYYQYAAKGAKLFDALNYLNADSKNKAITSQISSVTFGLTKDYAEIANAYTGILADQEQDAPAYAYYVLNSAQKYDLYILSDNVIYLPKDATKLFNGMSNMTTMNVDNLSTERTITFKGLFQNCTKLQSLDVSKWDVSNVTDFIAAFNQCNSLTLTGYENWNTAKVTNMSMLFQGNRAITEMDLSAWDMSSVTTMNAMFNGCTGMTKLNTTGWELICVSDFSGAFNDCKQLVQIDGIAGWGMGSATTLDHMFYNCFELESPDISNWNVSNVTNFKYMMAHAKSITSLDLSQWNVSKATAMNHMFFNCTSLETLNASNWQTGKVTTFNHMFASASQNTSDMKLTSVVGVEGWNTGSATQMYSMFYGCGQLTALDLSAWNVSKVISVSHMFADCSKLASLNLNGWDTSSLVTMDGMLNHCKALSTLNVSTFKTHNVKEFSQAFEGCENLQSIVGLENWNTANGCTFEEMFSGCTSLKALDLSSFNTKNARDSYKTYHGDTYSAFTGMLNGLSSLESLTLGENFCFTGNGTAKAVTLPAANNAEGLWYDEEGKSYTPDTIPQKTAGIYYAVNPVQP